MNNSSMTPGIPMAGDPNDLFSHTEGRCRTLFITAILLPIFCLPFLGLRIWTIIKIVQKWHIDDSLAIIAAIFCISQSVTVCIEARLGIGDHIWNIHPKGMGLMTKFLEYVGVPVYNLNTLFIKISILFFYLRFSIDPTFKFSAYFVTVVVIGYSLISALGPVMFTCTTGREKGCAKVSTVHLTSACFNIATDFTILLLPLWLLQPMKVSIRRKAGIAVGLMAGGFVAGISIIRLLAVIEVNATSDLPFKLGPLVLWSLIESWSGLVCACLPCLKPFTSRYFPSFILLGSQGSGSTRQLATIRLDDPVSDVEMQQHYNDDIISNVTEDSRRKSHQQI